MNFSEVIGQHYLKAHLQQSVKTGRIAHTQLFIGKTGSGMLPMALAYAQEILCQNHPHNSHEYNKCAQKIVKLAHPDLHFVFPVNSNEEIKKNPVSSQFYNPWREFVTNNPYASLYQWYQYIGIEKKQGNISKFEAEEIAQKLSLKAYEGGYKVMIIWMAEKMNTECSNKILKLVEEPPNKTVLLLLTEHEEQLLSTIQSRCQKLNFPLLSEEDIYNQLTEKQEVETIFAKKISHQSRGDFNVALQLLGQDNSDLIFEKWFIEWVRTAFSAKGNKKAILKLITWSEKIALEGRETQKKFLLFCIDLFRQALLKNYGSNSLVFFKSNDAKFSLEKFAPFVHQNNIFEISAALEKAVYHISRNGNSKIIFTDLSIKLTRLIHKKELV
ncbi:MAG: DNA polymerase III subunit [Flavobacteriales bacterium]